MKKWKIAVLLPVMVSLSAVADMALSQPQPEGVTVKKIRDAAGHSAFTDLIKFKGAYYCSFREGSGHIPGTDGVVRILKSPDAREWKSIAVLSRQGYDLRDPKLSVTPDGRLMVIIGGSVYENKKFLGREPFVSYKPRTERSLMPSRNWRSADFRMRRPSGLTFRERCT